MSCQRMVISGCAWVAYPVCLCSLNELVDKVTRSLDKFAAESPYPSRIVSSLRASGAVRERGLQSLLAATSRLTPATPTAKAPARKKRGKAKRGTTRSLWPLSPR